MRTMTFLVLGLVGTAAVAQEGIYVGLGIGSLDYEETLPGASTSFLSDTVSTYKVYGGFEINEHFAMEITYGESDDIQRTFSGNFPPFGTATLTTTVDLTTTVLRGIGQLPYDWGTLLGGIGFYSSDTDFRDTLVTQCCGVSTGAGTFSDDGLAAMIGIEWRFGRFGTGFGIRLEYEWLDIDLVDANTLGIGIAYRF